MTLSNHSTNSIVPIGDGAGGGEGGNGNGGDNSTNNSSESQVVASYDSRGKHIFVGNAKVWQEITDTSSA